MVLPPASRYSGSLAPPAFCRILAALFCDPARRRGPGLFLHARSRWRSERVRIPQPAGIAIRAALSLTQTSGAPGTKITLTGSGFAPSETVEVYGGHIGAAPFFTVTTSNT